MRILRIFKLVRHFAGLQSLFYTLQQAYQVNMCLDFPEKLSLLFSYFLTGIGTVGLGGSCGHPHLLFPGLLLIYKTSHHPYFVLAARFTLKSSKPGVLQSSPYQVYFAERESQISLGLDAVNCTGWVEGLNKLNLVVSYNF